MNVWATVLSAVNAFRSGDLLGGTIYSLEALTEVLRTFHPDERGRAAFSTVEGVKLEQLVDELETKAKAKAHPAELLPLLAEINNKATRQLAAN